MLASGPLIEESRRVDKERYGERRRRRIKGGPCFRIWAFTIYLLWKLVGNFKLVCAFGRKWGGVKEGLASPSGLEE